MKKQAIEKRIVKLKSTILLRSKNLAKNNQELGRLEKQLKEMGVST